MRQITTFMQKTREIAIANDRFVDSECNSGDNGDDDEDDSSEDDDDSEDAGSDEDNDDDDSDNKQSVKRIKVEKIENDTTEEDRNTKHITKCREDIESILSKQQSLPGEHLFITLLKESQHSPNHYSSDVLNMIYTLYSDTITSRAMIPFNLLY